MAFLNPLLLFGCLSIAAPIIIHLFSRRVVKKTVWAAMRFLQQTIQQNQKRINIEDLLLLVLRCLLLIFLALALARPTLRSAAGLGGATTAIIAIDNSYSMCASDGVSSRLEKAKQAAEQLVDSLSIGSSMAVLTVSDVAKGVISVPTTDRNTARKIIRGIRPTSRGTDWLTGLRMALEIAARSSGSGKEVDIITDGQNSGWRQSEEIRTLLREDRDIAAVRMILVGERTSRNVGISGLRLAGAVPTVGQALRFEVEVTNYGSEDAVNVPVNLAADDEPPQDTTTLDALPAGGSRSVSLFAKLREDGYHTLTAATTPDQLTADDQRTIALHVLKEMSVLLVEGNGGAVPRDTATFFLRNALVPVPSTERERYFLKLKAVTPSELDNIKLGDFEAIFLADVSDLSPRTLESIAAYLRRGGGLLIFPGPHTNAAFYNKELLDHYRFLPARLDDAHGDATQGIDNKGFALQVANYEHPLVTLWNDPASGTLGSARFYRAFTLQPAPAVDRGKEAPGKAATDPAGSPQVVLRFADNSPMLMERTWGAGRVFLFASTANTVWNDLPVRPAFVPLLYRTLSSVVSRKDERLNVVVGGRFSLAVEPEALGKEATVTAPTLPMGNSDKTKLEEVRDQRRIEMIGDTATLQYEDTDIAGSYKVTMPGETAPAYRFAVQADSRESHLEGLTQAQIDQFAPLRVVRWTPSANLKDTANRARRGAEFWLPFALLALACAIGEMMLADWFSKSK